MLGHILMGLGALLLFLGGVGFIRFPDPYCRLQAAGVADVGGASLVVVGLMFGAGWGWELGVLIIFLFLLLFTGPVVTHAIAKAAFVRRHPPEGKR